MFNDRRLIILFSALLILIAVNSYFLSQVYKHQQHHSLVLNQLHHQLTDSENHRMDIEEQVHENQRIMENKLTEHQRKMGSALEQLDFLAEENELLKKKLQ